MATDDFANNAGTAGKLALDLLASGKFEEPQDSDWFAVDLQAGLRYVFTIQSPASDYWSNERITLALQDASGRQIGETVTGASWNLPAIDFTAPATGKYYLAAGQNYLSIPLGSYSVLAVRHPGTDDYTATSATTGKLAADGTVNGVFNVYGDRDWIKFHATPTSHYSFSKTSGVNPATSRIFDATGNLVGQYAYEFDVAKAGDYYLEVLGLETGAYTMALKEWKDDFPATDAGAGLVAAGGSAVHAAIDYQKDEDYFQVRLEAGQYYTIAVGDGNYPMPADIFAPSGKQVGSIHLMTSAQGTTLLAPESGTYYIHARLQMMTTLIKEPVPYYVKVSAAVTDDIGNTPAQAALAEVGVTARGSLQSGGDVDVFKVALRAGVTYSFSTEGPTQDSARPLFEITGADGKTLGQSGQWLTGLYTFTPAASGDYYVAVSAPGYGMTANYAYTFKVGAPADDAGAYAAGAAGLAVGATVSGKLEEGGGDVDWYAVNLTAGTTYWLDADATGMSSGSEGRMRVLDAAGGELAQARSTFFSNFSDAMAFVPTASGTYYVEISSPKRATGSYTVSVQAGERDDAGDTAQTAVPLAPGATASGRLELGSDKDMYRISTAPGVTYMLTAETGVNGNPDVAIVDAAGKPLPFKELWTGHAWPQRLLFTGPADGNAYVMVSQEYDNSSATYTLTTRAYGVDDYSADKNTAGRLAHGSSVQGTLGHPTDADWVRIALEAGKTYAFQLLGSYSGGGTLASMNNFLLSVVGNGYTWSGVTANAIKNAVEARVLFTAAQTGDYFVNVGGYEYLQSSNAQGSYTLRALQTTGDTAGPGLVAQSHPSDGTGVDLFATRFDFRFNEPVSIDPTAIDIRDSQGRKLSLYGAGPWVNDDTVSFKVFNVLKPGSYTVNIPHGAIFDLAGNPYTGPETIRFTTKLPVAAGTPGADLLAGGDGVIAVTLDGGAGVDMVRYDDNYYYQKIERTAEETRVTLTSGKAVDVLKNVERLVFGNQFYALDIDGNAGQAYRLYQAAFNRSPDIDGLGYWIGQLDKGVSLRDMARGFVASAEFKSLYGAAPGDDAFLTSLYHNVLHRAPETAGYNYWIDLLRGGMAREDVLVSFGESAENKAAALEIIGNGFTYTPFAG